MQNFVTLGRIGISTLVGSRKPQDLMLASCAFLFCSIIIVNLWCSLILCQTHWLLKKQENSLKKGSKYSGTTCLMRLKLLQRVQFTLLNKVLTLIIIILFILMWYAYHTTRILTFSSVRFYFSSIMFSFPVLIQGLILFIVLLIRLMQATDEYNHLMLPHIEQIPLWLMPEENLVCVSLQIINLINCSKRFYWTENHMIMYTSSSFLLKQMFGEEVRFVTQS